MPYSTIISVEDLFSHLNDAHWVVVDCRFSLADTGRGRTAYLASHIPGAVYAHLDYDLSGRIIPGKTGRHPLPSVEQWVDTLSGWGISKKSQVVAYDDLGGGIAARLWWMLRWVGHENVAVLDGGWSAWEALNYPVHQGQEHNPRSSFELVDPPLATVSADDVEQIRTDPDFRLLDARAAERYRGEFEPIDPVAGHIPGALSAPFKENLDSRGYFLSPEQLRQRFNATLGTTPAGQVVNYCGSGVTACHNVLALYHAGLGMTRLYPGSWSEWILRENTNQ